MKVAQHLQIEKVVHQRAIPSDIESDQTLYYSESKGVHIDILQMDLHHLIRVTKKLLDKEQEREDSLVNRVLKRLQQ
jgi:hypothetical protein